MLSGQGGRRSHARLSCSASAGSQPNSASVAARFSRCRSVSRTNGRRPARIGSIDG